MYAQTRVWPVIGWCLRTDGPVAEQAQSVRIITCNFTGFTYSKYVLCCILITGLKVSVRTYIVHWHELERGRSIAPPSRAGMAWVDRCFVMHFGLFGIKPTNHQTIQPSYQWFENERPREGGGAWRGNAWIQARPEMGMSRCIIPKNVYGTYSGGFQSS